MKTKWFWLGISILLLTSVAHADSLLTCKGITNQQQCTEIINEVQLTDHEKKSMLLDLRLEESGLTLQEFVKQWNADLNFETAPTGAISYSDHSSDIWMKIISTNPSFYDINKDTWFIDGNESLQLVVDFNTHLPRKDYYGGTCRLDWTFVSKSFNIKVYQNNEQIYAVGGSTENQYTFNIPFTAKDGLNDFKVSASTFNYLQADIYRMQQHEKCDESGCTTHYSCDHTASTKQGFGFSNLIYEFKATKLKENTDINLTLNSSLESIYKKLQLNYEQGDYQNILLNLNNSQIEIKNYDLEISFIEPHNILYLEAKPNKDLVEKNILNLQDNTSGEYSFDLIGSLNNCNLQITTPFGIENVLSECENIPVSLPKTINVTTNQTTYGSTDQVTVNVMADANDENVTITTINGVVTVPLDSNGQGQVSLDANQVGDVITANSGSGSEGTARIQKVNEKNWADLFVVLEYFGVVFFLYFVIKNVGRRMTCAEKS